MYRTLCVTTLAALMSLTGCANEGTSDDLNGTSQALDGVSCGDVPGPGQFDRSVVVHGTDMQSEDWALFGLEETLQNIIDSNAALPGDETTPQQLLNSMLNGLNITDTTDDHVVVFNPISDLPVELQDIDVCDDPALGCDGDPVADLSAYEPIAFFNRLDLAPGDWSNCGEHRIVYEHNSLELWLIFEAKLPNPALESDEVGAAGDPMGCRPVAEFWTNLGSENLTSSQIADRLQEFFYEGYDDLAPVVQHANYAEGLGQVRTNHINIDAPAGAFDFWQLRELRTDVAPDGSATFAVDTVKGNPLTELYRSGIPSWIDDGDDTVVSDAEQNYITLRDGYLRGFADLGDGIEDANANNIPDRLEELLSPELNGTPIIGGFGLNVAPELNEFMSLGNNTDNPANNPMPELEAAIASTLTGLGFSADEVTAEHILNRADVQTCGGCHGSAVGSNLGFDLEGESVAWPNNAGGDFVHVRQNQLSATLVDHLLPARMAHLEAARSIVTNVADTNLDGSVNVTDLLLLLSNYGSDEPLATADFNGDCQVNVNDLLIMLGQFGWNDPTDMEALGLPAGERGPEPKAAERGTDGSDTSDGADEADANNGAGTAGQGLNNERPSSTRDEARTVREAEHKVAEARNSRERRAAIERLRNLRRDAEAHQRSQEGAFIRVRPTH